MRGSQTSELSSNFYDAIGSSHTGKEKREQVHTVYNKTTRTLPWTELVSLSRNEDGLPVVFHHLSPPIAVLLLVIMPWTFFSVNGPTYQLEFTLLMLKGV